MLRIALFAALAATSFAQNAPEAAQTPPAGVEDALRARITEFYQFHVTEEYRKAEKMVAEDSQDIYYVASKPHYLNFEIKTIAFSDDFTKAKVSVLCERHLNGLGFAGKPVKVPSTSTWKIENGKWMFYVGAEELRKGPFGTMANAGTKAAPGTAVPDNIPTDPGFVLGKVKLDKDSLTVKPDSSFELKIANKSPAAVSLVLEQRLPGYEITIDKADLGIGEETVVRLKTNENPHSGEITFRVNPLGEVLSLVVKR